ncbi:MAG TPA: hypothetical protein VFR27_09185 [Mycobacterium sp.]|nr:hypothetical protein [Mycobacterium sp.]
MASRERPASAFDTGHLDDAPEPTTAELAELAEAEAAAAEAEAHAAAARAHAMRLRWKAAGGIDPSRQRLHRPKPRGVALGAAVMLLCASLAASGYLVWHHHVASQERQRTAEFAAAARQAVATLMSLDFNKTEQDLQRIAGISTGQFREGFQAVADQLTKRLQVSKVVTKATVNDVAVESMTGDSAIVLVAAATEVTEPKTPDAAQLPQSWHIALRLNMDGGQPKMSSIEFIE